MKNALLCGLALLLLMNQAFAQTVPPCTAAGHAGNSYETAVSGVFERLVCNGSAFVPLESWAAAGTRTIDFGNDTSACDASRSGRLRYTGGTTWEYCNGAAWVSSGVGGTTAAVSGTNGQVQFNNNGAFGADSNLIWDNTNKGLTIGAATSVRQLTVSQLGNSLNGILLSGKEQYNSIFGDANGVALILGVNRAGNRQLWIGDNSAVGSATNGLFRLSSGTPLPGIDGIAGNGITRLHLNFGTITTNVAVGYEYSGTTGTNLPLNKLSIYGNSSVGVGYITNTAPTNGLLVEGNVGIGRTAPTAKLDVNGAIKVGVSSDACDATAGGKIRYNATPKIMEYCNESTWMAM